MAHRDDTTTLTADGDITFDGPAMGLARADAVDRAQSHVHSCELPSMLPMVSTTISHYEILEKLGQGGMGEVFLAHDSSLDRRVAVKFLSDEFSRDPERLARFSREAKILGSLSHPNIAAVHGLEQAGDRRFIVMELAEGETLEKRLASRTLPPKEAFEICRQVAEGLEAAQEKGIVHRDLKPSNVMVSSDGKVKILDFGLAKALDTFPSGDLRQTLTMEANATLEGTIVGTAPYMSPEQATGRQFDTRTDIWSFGCLLFELLSRRRAFPGETAMEVLARVLEREPDWSQLPAAVPENVKCLLRRCLQKDQRSRLHSISDARIEIEDTLAGRIPGAVTVQVTRKRTLASAAAAGLLLGVIATGLWALSRTVPPLPLESIRFSFDLPPGAPLMPTWNGQIAFSPDGRTLAYSHGPADAQVTSLRRFGELDGRPLPDAPGMSVPVFSPDGRHVIVMDPMASALKKAAIGGGAPVLFANFDMAFRGDWAADDFYYWTTHYFGPIVRTKASSGGSVEPVTALDLEKHERTHRHVQVLPGGKAMIFTVSTGGISSFNDAHIDLFTFATKTRQTIVQDGFSPRYSPSGHIVYARAGKLYAVPFDNNALKVTGPEFEVVDGVFMSTNSGSAHFDISPNGNLAYAVGKAEGGMRTLVWVDRAGNETPLPDPPFTSRSYLFPRISPDGKRIAFEVEGVNHDLYTYDVERGVETPFTTDGVSHAPVWTPDASRIAFRSWKAGTMTMWWMPADLSGPDERLTMVGARQSVVSFSPKGDYVTFNQMETMGSGDMGMMGGELELGSTGIWVLPMKGDRTPRRFYPSKFIQGSGRFSMDGKWVAYCANEGGGNEVYVQPWPGPGPKVKVSSGGGTDPIWSPTGKELFYRNGDKMMVVAVKTQPTFDAGRPTELWERHYSHGLSSSCGPPGTSEGNYDVNIDGQRFLMVKDVDLDAQSTRIVVVLNFAEELKARAVEQQRQQPQQEKKLRASRN